jgi:hypothetical protein
MNSPQNKTLPPKNRVTPEELEQALMHWDELDDPSLAILAEHPATAHRLAGLLMAEEWIAEGGLADDGLAERAGRPPSASPCPSAEQLFDFRNGSVSASGIETHLEECAECADLVASLASRPPSPLSLLSDEEPEPQFKAPVRPHRGTWVPLVVAASLVGITLIPMLRGIARGGTPSPFPSHSLVRGSHTNGILFPRGRVLANQLGARPQFELPQVEEASSYRVQVYRFTGSAFEQGEQILSLAQTTPLLSLAQDQRLSAGYYSWQAFAEVRGLEQPVGAGGEFQVIEEAQLASKLEAALHTDALAAGPALQLIHELEARGFSSDARQLARRLPTSPERDAYLNGPGR